jgi:putative peptidoglycan lipid II flippase
VGIIAFVSNMVLNLVITVPWALSDLPAPHAGLAISTSLAAFINAGLLYRGLRREIYRPLPGWGRLWLQALAGNAAMVAVLWWGVPGFESWLAWGLWERAGRLVLWVGAGALAYALTLLLGGVRPRDFGRYNG